MPVNPLPLNVEKNQNIERNLSNLSVEAKTLLGILNELEDFTANLKKRIIGELKPETNQEAEKRD